MTMPSKGIMLDSLVYVVRTTIATVASLLFAQAVGLPEPYWAVIGAMIVTQSSLGSALTVSGQRIVATVLGAFLGAFLANTLGSNIVSFIIGIFGLGLICALSRLDKPAYRFGGISLAVVMYASNNGPHLLVALNRSLEISVGIVCGLAIAVLWPEHKLEAETNTKSGGQG